MLNRVVICFVNALVLLTAHLIYFNANWSIPLEDEMMTLVNKAENYLFKEGKFKDSSFLFINTAYDNNLLRIAMEDGDSGNIVITDRMLLSRLFKKMADHNNQHRYILCDLLFDKPSENDGKLACEIDRLDKIIFPSTSSGEELQNAITQKSAHAEYVTFEGMVSKIRLYSKSTHSKTLPLQMYEGCNKKRKSEKSFMGLWCNNYYIPTAIYPRYFFNSHQVKKHELRLSQVIKLLEINDSLFYNSSLKGRVLVIGDFSTNYDRHPTLLGQYVPGSIILFNTFLTLEAGYHLHGWAWFVFIIISFGLLTYYELYHKKKEPGNGWSVILNLLQLSGLCILLSLISNLVFNIHTTILPMIVYFETVSFLEKKLFRNPFI
jgi:hypothetical protein